MRFRPSLLATVVVGVCVLIQLQLAAWQWGRHVDQRGRVTDVAERIRAAPARNGDLGAGAEALIWRKASLTGTFEPDNTYITGRFEFGEPGFDVVGVLQVDDGPRVLVNRGWIPMRGWSTHAAAVGPGPARVDGLLLPADGSMVVSSGCASPPTAPLPATEDAPERWAGPVWPAIAQAQGGELLPVVLYAGPELARPTDKVRDPLPATGWIARPKHVGHLEYVGQWLLIAAVFVGGWVYAGIARGRREGDG